MWLFDLDRWQEVFAVARRNKLRTFLTAAGVFWGMFMLLVMLGFGDGLERAVTSTMSGYATNAVYMWGQRATMPYRGHRPGRWVAFQIGDIEALEEIDDIEYLAPRNQLGGWRDGSVVTNGTKVGSFSVMGDVPDFLHIQPVAFDSGRWINDLDLRERRKVAIVGKQVVDELFGPGADPVGQQIAIQGVYFQVVGAFHSKSKGDDADRQNGAIHIPFSTFERTFNWGDRVGWITVTGKPDVSGVALEDQLKRVMMSRHGLHPDDVNAIGSRNAEEEFQRIGTLFSGIRTFLWIVGVATLLTGIVGVSNILLIVVRERTKEIGLRRALGATPWSVVSLVIQESVVLTGIAGYLGLVCAVAFMELVSLLVGPDNEVLSNPQVSFEVAVIIAIVLVTCGALAGVVPARRAAAIHPVTALRAE